jgi:hypothetical protein
VTELTATYGFGPWLTMPVRELLPYIARRAHIEAQRAIDLAERVAVGVGRLKADEHRAAVARWRADLDVGGPARAKGRDPEQLAAAARASGVAFRTVKVR